MGEPQLKRPEADEVIKVCTEYTEDNEKIKELQAYIDMVKKLARPGCSEEVLKVAVSSMSSLVGVLSIMSSSPKLRASL